MRGTGIGPALRQARLLRAKSIEEASRETRIRREYLQALEGERFESLLGDVYVRGFLRSYSSYLGLDPDKVLGAYNRSFGPPRPTLPQPPPGPVRRRGQPAELPGTGRHHPSWAFLVGVAILALAVFGAAGLLSRSGGEPEAAAPGPAMPAIDVLPPSVVVTLTASEDVRAEVVVDDQPVGPGILPGGVIREGQGLSFTGESRIDLRLERGGVVRVRVNGHSLGSPGSPRRSFSASFRPEDYRRSSSTTGGNP